MGGSPADILNKLRKPQVVKEFFTSTSPRSASSNSSSPSSQQVPSSQVEARIRGKKKPTAPPVPRASSSGSSATRSSMEEARPTLHPAALERIPPASPLLFPGVGPDADAADEDHHDRAVGLPIELLGAVDGSSRSFTKLHKKSVSFSSLEIREYEVVIGDHPCCTRGVPLTLGWEYHEGGRLNLDDYEEGRSPRRSRFEMRTSSEERCDILSDVATQHDLRRAQRKMHRVRSCSAKLCERVNAKFFDASDPMTLHPSVSSSS